MSSTPIADHALLSDCHSAALVTTDGSIDWLCFPRFDSPSVFGRVLDAAAGHWSIAALDEIERERRYLDGTMVLETTVRTATGVARLTDAMALGAEQDGHDLGLGAPGMVLRDIEVVEGEVTFEMVFAPRPEYGLIHPLLTVPDGGVFVRGGAHLLALSFPVKVEIDGATATSRVHLHKGERVSTALHHQPLEDGPPTIERPDEIEGRLAGTVDAWRRWSSVHQAYEGPWSDLVYHSGRVLQALMYQPTGAIVAAPTTSLPEQIGGERNWDYRFAWVRDASFTLDALWVAACPDEAHKFFSWMSGAVASGLDLGRDLQIMFGVGGEHDLSERELPHLAGWRDSRPVRVGNGAWSQRQLDVYGELLGAAHRLRSYLGPLDDSTKRFLRAVADAAADRWESVDHGIWEVRGEPRHFLYSKLMCWVALDRAIELAPTIGSGDRVPAWTTTRREIREAILREGWSEQAGAFTQSFGDDHLDASALVMPIVGFLPADDPRVLATIDAIERRLTDEQGLVYRYRVQETDDGLEGEEGSFLLCTFWLAEALALADEGDRAAAVFERAAAHVNDVGLMSEEIDASSGELLGNFPQAFSHVGLINAAWAIARLEVGLDPGGPKS
ncbi:MAG: glycoside hydrolase family 15 protein [Actinomycetota bacterium]